jgi:sulfane dehydrogenase subunit SoxC
MSTPSFAAPLNPARYVRQLRLEPHQQTAPRTSQADLFTLAHLGIPEVDVAEWRLAIEGLVERPQLLTFDAIRQLPKREVESFHQCAGAPRRPDLAMRRVANLVWGGVDLSTLLATAGLRSEARFLWAFGLDHGDYDGESAEWYVKDMPLSRLAEGGVLLAYEVNGEPLMREHGFPLRLVIPGYYGTNAVKWLWRLELAERRAGGPFTTVLYNDPVPGSRETRPVWDAPPEALIVAPAGKLSGAGPFEIWGWAWAASGVAAVAISVDGGITWSPASLDPRRDWSWQRFAFSWQPSGTGSFTVLARATDTRGTVQPIAKARNAVHAVTIEI